MIHTLSISIMNSKTFNKRLHTLSSEIHRHPHADELLNIMSQQLEDDTSVVDREIIEYAA